MRSLATDLKIPFCPGLEFFGIDFFPRNSPESQSFIRGMGVSPFRVLLILTLWEGHSLH